ncbi:MAG TPA: hypothetical protein GX392_04805 [Clostridiales bacterium]|nr:hypothetical protein [Clostridiales bacterium]
MSDNLATSYNKYISLDTESLYHEESLSRVIYNIQTYWAEGIKGKLPGDCLYTYMSNLKDGMHFSDICAILQMFWYDITEEDIYSILTTDKRFKQIGYNIWGLHEWKAYAEVQTDFQETLREVKTRFTDRNWTIFYMYKISSKRYTYEEIGNMYGLTRERVRQITNQGVRKFKHVSYMRKFDYYRYFLLEKLDRQKIILLEQLNTTYQNIFGNCNPTEVINTLNTIKVDFIIVNDKYILKKAHFQSIEIFLTKIKKSIPKGQIYEHPMSYILKILDIDTDIGKDMFLGLIDSSNKFFYNHINGILYMSSVNITKADIAYIVLREIGEPIHYTCIGEKYGELTGEHPSKRLVLSYLDRHDEIVRVFTGIYGLKEWGCEEHVGLLELATEVLEDEHQIMHYMDIYEKIKDRTMAKPSSLISLISNDDRFVIPCSGYVGLSKWIEVSEREILQEK